MKIKTLLALDPLLVFALGAMLLFFFDAYINEKKRPEIVITTERRATTLGQAEALKGGALTATESQQAIDTAIDQQVIFNEALRLGLHEDQNIQSALLRHYRAILTAALPAPTDNELREYYQQHIFDFMGPLLFDVDVILLAADALNTFPTADSASPQEAFETWLGVPAIKSDYQRYSERDLVMLYGQNIADSLATAPQNTWYGPLKNIHGVFYLRVVKRFDASPRPYDSIQNYVRDAWKRARQDKLLTEKIQVLKSGYRIRQEP